MYMMIAYKDSEAPKLHVFSSISECRNKASYCTRYAIFDDYGHCLETERGVDSLARWRDERETSDDIISDLEYRVASLTESNDSAKAELAEVEAQSRLFQTRMETLEHDNRVLKDNLDKTKHNDFQEQIERLMRRMQDKEEELANKKHAQYDLEFRLSNHEKTITMLSKQLNTYEDERRRKSSASNFNECGTPIHRRVTLELV